MKKIIMLLSVLLFAVSLTSCGGGGSSLSDDEQYVLDCINQYKTEYGVTVNKLYDGVTVINAEISGEKVRYAIIPYGGTSSSGSVQMEEAVFIDGEYSMDRNEAISNDGSDSSLEKAVIYRNTGIAFAEAAGWDVVDIDEEKIQEQLKN